MRLFSQWRIFVHGWGCVTKLCGVAAPTKGLAQPPRGKRTERAPEILIPQDGIQVVSCSNLLVKACPLKDVITTELSGRIS